MESASIGGICSEEINRYEENWDDLVFGYKCIIILFSRMDHLYASISVNKRRFICLVQKKKKKKFICVGMFAAHTYISFYFMEKLFFG